MKYFFFSVFFLLLISLIIIYINISNVNLKQTQEIPQIPIVEKKESSIVKLLANTEVENVFPAKELYLKIDLNYIPKTRILYQTVINNLDKYKLFGVEQVLSLNHIRYSIIKSRNNLKLFMNFNKVKDATKIQQLFKSYNFNVTLKKLEIKGQQ